MKLPPWRLSAVSILVPLGGSFHFGYQLVVTNPTQAIFEQFINTTLQQHYNVTVTTDDDSLIELLWSAATAILMLGAICGSLLMPFVADFVGRKRGLYISSVLILIGCVIAALSYTLESFEVFALIRFPIGIGLGVAVGLQSLYLNEISPKRWRGATSTCTGLMLQIGVVVGSVTALGHVFGTDTLWPFMYWVELAPSLVLIATLPFMEESPGYLLRNGFEERARRSIQQFHGCATEVELEETFQNLVEQLKAEAQTKKMSYVEVLRDPQSRRGTLVGCLVATGMAFTSIPVVNSYATKLITQSGLSQDIASWGNLAIGVSSLVGSLIGMVTIDKFGRRLLVIGVNVLIVLLNIGVLVVRVLFLQYGGEEYGWALIGLTVIFMLVFAAGPGPIAFFMTTELVSQSARGSAQGLTTLAQMSWRTVILFAFLPIDNLVRPYGYLMFVVPLLAISAALYFYLPETKRRNYAEVLIQNKKLPTLKRLFVSKEASKVAPFTLSTIKEEKHGNMEFIERF